MTTRHASGPLRVIRVTGLPPGTPHELQAFLSALIEDKIGVDCQETSFEISIIPSCYNWDAGKVGLVDFRGRFPSFLGDLISGERDVVQLQTALGDISFDNNFRGFTQLYPVEPSEQATAE